ncbi:unnamed protein product [Closterium sp. NIES-54]
MTTPNNGSSAGDLVNNNPDTQASTTGVPGTDLPPRPVIYIIQTPPTGAPSAPAAGTGNRAATRRASTRVRPAHGTREVIDLDTYIAGLPASDDDLGELDDIAPPNVTGHVAAPAATFTTDTTTDND